MCMCILAEAILDQYPHLLALAAQVLSLLFGHRWGLVLSVLTGRKGASQISNLPQRKLTGIRIEEEVWPLDGCCGLLGEN